MTMLFVSFFFMFMTTTVTASCSEGEMPRFCRNNEPVPQNYCTGVQFQAMWQCRPGSNARCACRPSLFRAANRKCVEEAKCGQNVQNRQPAKAQVPKPEPPMIVPEQLQADPNDEPNVRKLIQKTKELYLLEISENAWKESECMCLDSILAKETESGGKRKIGCYLYVPSILIRNGIQGPPVMQIRRSISREITADFDVIRDGWLYLKVTSTENDGPNPTPLQEHERLQGKFDVLDYGDDCLLLGFGSFARAQFDCIALVSLNNQGEYTKGEKCFGNVTEICRSPMVNVWKNECKNEYKRKKRRPRRSSQRNISIPRSEQVFNN